MFQILIFSLLRKKILILSLRLLFSTLFFLILFRIFLNLFALSSSSNTILAQYSSTSLPSTSCQKSSRTHKPPSYLYNYHCHLASSNASPPSSSINFIDLESSKHYPISFFFKLFASPKVYTLVISLSFELYFFHQVIKFSR